MGVEKRHVERERNQWSLSIITLFLAAPQSNAVPCSLVENGLVMLHEPTCEDRVETFEKLKNYLVGTRCEAACAALARVPLDVQPTVERPDGKCVVCI